MAQRVVLEYSCERPPRRFWSAVVEVMRQISRWSLGIGVGVVVCSLVFADATDVFVLVAVLCGGTCVMLSAIAAGVELLIVPAEDAPAYRLLCCVGTLVTLIILLIARSDG